MASIRTITCANSACRPSVGRLLLNRGSLPVFIQRVANLRADTPRQWGTMDTSRMIQHLIFMTESFDFQLPSPSSDFPAQQAEFIRLMERFVAEFETNPDRKTLSPLLGMITIRQWSRVHGVHNNHHLRQFGV